MSLSTTIIRRLVTSLALCAATAAGAAPAALAGHQDIGTRDALTQIHHTELSRASSAQSAEPDAIDRYLRNHVRPAKANDCDAVCRYLHTHTAAVAVEPAPDTIDAARTAQAGFGGGQNEVVRTSGFAWRDAGIGASAMLGITFLVGSASLLARQNRRRPANS
jgi:ketosteroid isomerase-like protein